MIEVDLEFAVMLLIGSFGVVLWQEENIYRGYLQPKLEAIAGRWKANISQAILFSIAHIGFWQSPSLKSLAVVALIGFILGYYRQHYRSLVAPFIAHGLVDFLPIFW